MGLRLLALYGTSINLYSNQGYGVWTASGTKTLFTPVLSYVTAT